MTSSTATTVPAVAAPNLTFIAVSTTGFGASKSDARKAEPRQKSNNSVILVAALGGLCVLILVVGGTLAALSLGSSETATSPANQSAQLAESNSGSSPEGTSSVESEANPASPRDSVAEGEGEESAAPVAPSLVARSPSADSETAQLVKQITSWNKLSKSRTQLGLKNIARFEVNSMWLASDATGRPVAAKPAATNGASQTVAGGSASSSSSQPAEVPKFIFAELTISNTGDRPVQYLGWNSPSESAAILVDGTGQVLVPVAPAETPKVARLSATVIAPGGTVTDTFVFKAPPGTVNTLRLALPKVALSSAAKGFFAIEIPPAMLSVRTTENSGRSPNPSLAGPGEASARDEFAELQRQLMESEDSTATKPVSSTGDDTAPPAVGAEPLGDASGTPAEPKKPPTAAEFDKFLREMDEKEATDNPDASPTPDAPPASK